MAEEDLRALVRRLEQNLAAAADDVDLRLRLAESYQRLGEARLAGAQWKEVARLRLKRYQMQPGVEALSLAAAQLPNDFQVRETLYTIARITENPEKQVTEGMALADLFRRARQGPRAEEILLRCLQLGGERADVRRALADTYYQMGSPEKARPHYQQLAEHHPDERERKKIRAILETMVARTPAAMRHAVEPVARRRRPPAWAVICAIAVVVAGLGLQRHVGFARAGRLLREATAQAGRGDLAGAAALLRGAGGPDGDALRRAGDEADRLAQVLRAAEEHGRLDAGLRRGHAARAELAALSRSATDPEVRRLSGDRASALETEVAVLHSKAASLASRIDSGQHARALEVWRELRAADALRICAGDLGAREVVLRLASIPPGAEVRLADRVLGVTPCEARCAATAPETTVTLAYPGHASVTVALGDAPAAEWRITLPRRVRYRIAADGPVTGWTAVGDTVYVAGRARVVVAADARTGHERWRIRFAPGQDVTGAPAVAGGRAIVALGDGTLAALALADGRRGGPLDGRTGVAGTPVALGADAIALPTTGGDLVALGVADGAERWRHGPLEGAVELTATADSVVAVAGALAVVLDLSGTPRGRTVLGATARGPASPLGDGFAIPLGGGRVAVLDRQARPWAGSPFGPGQTGAATLAGDEAWFGTADGRVLAGAPGGAATRVRMQLDGPVQALASAAGCGYAVNGAGRLMAWRTGDERPRWEADLGGALAGTCALAADLILVPTTADALLAIEAEVP